MGQNVNPIGFRTGFIEKWKDRGDEKQDTQLFWLGFMEDVLGIQNSRDLIEFEHEV